MNDLDVFINVFHPIIIGTLVALFIVALVNLVYRFTIELWKVWKNNHPF